MFKLIVGIVGVFGSATSTASHASVAVGGWFFQTDANTTIHLSPTESQNGQSLAFDNPLVPVSTKHSLSTITSFEPTGANAAITVDSQLSFDHPQNLSMDILLDWNLSNSPELLSYVRGGSNIGYTFYTDKNYAFNFDYAIKTDSESVFGSGFIGLSGNNGYVFYNDFLLNENGSYSGIIGPGSYYLQINHTNISYDYFYQSQKISGKSEGVYNFSLSNPVVPVPEPSSWVLMLSGFMVVGKIMRRGKPRLAQDYTCVRLS